MNDLSAIRTGEVTAAKRPDKPLYLMAFTVGQVRCLAFGSLAVSFGLALLGIFDSVLTDSTLFASDLSRFVFCFSMAISLAVFFFVFHPEPVEMPLPVAAGLALRIGGPLAIGMGVFIFLWSSMPVPPTGRVFEIYSNNKAGGMYLESTETTYITVPGKNQPSIWLIGDNDGSRSLYGIYVHFPPNVRSIKGFLHHDGWSIEVPVELSRTGSNMIDVTAAVKGN